MYDIIIKNWDNCMRTELEYLEFRNFMSYGNELTRIDFKDYNNIMISGDNGNGKSVIPTALIYCLYGKAYRDKIVLGDLVNTRNKKDLYTKCGFRKGSSFYEITRTQKPNSLTMYKNGVEELKNISSTEFQTVIDAAIGADYKTFCQVAIIDATLFVPFLSLSPAEKTLIVDRIFGLDVISELLKKVKVHKKELQGTHEQLTFKINTTEEQIKTIEAINEKLKAERNEEHDKNILKLNTQIKSFESLIKLAEARNKKLQEYGKNIDYHVEEYSKEKSRLQTQVKLIQDSFEYDHLQLQLRTNQSRMNAMTGMKSLYNQKNKEILDEIERLTREVKENENKKNNIKTSCKTKIAEHDFTIKLNKQKIEYYQNHDTCDSCEQCIDPSFKSSKLLQLTSDNNALNEKKKELLEENKIIFDKLTEQITELESKITELRKTTFQNKLSKIETILTKLEMKIRPIANKLKLLSVLNFKEAEFSMFEEYQEKLRDYDSSGNPWLAKQSKCKTIQAKIKIKIQGYQSNIQRIKSDMNELEKKKMERTELQETQVFKSSLRDMRTEMTQLENTMKTNILSEEMLSNDGVRKFINDSNLPFLNKYLSQFLDMFEMNIPIKLNNKFDEEISERSRGASKYGSLSKGERACVNFSILFSLLTFIERQNSVNLGFVFMDESDSMGFDQDRKEKVLSILKERINKKCIVISHDSELKNLFETHFEIQKVNGFSKILRN